MSTRVPQHAVVVAVCTALLGASGVGAAGDKVLFENAQVRLVEVTHRPGEPSLTAPVPYASVLAVDAEWPAVLDAPRDPVASARELTGNRVQPPDHRPYPWCQTRSAQAAHALRVLGDFPLHYYRVDYKRVDGANYAGHWKELHPWILQPVSKPPDLGFTPQPGEPYSNEFPFPLVYDAAKAAPENHFMRYEDEHIQFLEVAFRPGETENMHGHQYSSVFFRDQLPPPGVEERNVTLRPGSPNPQGPLGRAPGSAAFPTCNAAVPEAPHQVSIVKGDYAEHFYRLQFKRIDGADIRRRWTEWYPRG